MILEAVIGSHAYGLATPESDVDRRGVFVAPTEAFWRLEKPPTSVEGPSAEQLSWEVEHFCRLGLKSNPTVLETLVSPLVEISTPMGEELRDLLPAFLSRYAVRAFTRATEMQLSRAGRNLKPKQLMHVVRLRLVGLHLLRTGRYDIAADRSLLKIRDGSMPWDDAVAWAHRLGDEIAAAEGPLPEDPDRARVEDWLVSVRRRML
ncbi:nucleotidyltransferase domain-containing protein [Lentzea sp. BCCO 10_0061]|uniref:Nucleotidyltransferase domain-containing protein n=1 Tax=Lentzea sokolovensis TaxID=3095429 RepID=A0ABU4V924_9PSEU|nr:nucleotidyltransferase domain-containing protein [Lentzea sp. BCCO 10_0061]MDX8148301.1 nucleotidyltransferase domain-containing protein [Lentzea sp. BCCO 10_0061]